MNFGLNAYAIASHSVLILIALLIVWRVMRSYVIEDFAIVDPHNLQFVISLMALGVAIERIYYVAARALRSSGVDLWSAHPAPEVLSLLVAFTLYFIMVPFIVLKSQDAWGALRFVAIEWSVLALIWAVIAGVLR